MPGLGLHRVAAITGSATRNLDFYTRVLGLRLLKRTVGHDDPGSYNFHYGVSSDRMGGTLDIVAWEGIPVGRRGKGEVRRVLLRAAHRSLAWWQDRLQAVEIHTALKVTALGELLLTFRDPDGIPLGILAPDADDCPPLDGPSGAIGLAGVGGVILTVANAGMVAALLTDTLGLSEDARAGDCIGLRTPDGARVLLQGVGRSPRGRTGRGTVSHVAFRATDDAQQATISQHLKAYHGITATGVVDRVYFRSITFREPGGTLFEIATDAPGFACDEPAETLGSVLMLPPHLEPRRAELRRILPPLL